MCSLWGSRSAHCGAISVLTAEQSNFPVRSNRCAQCGAANVLSVEQSMCSLWSNQCAQCGATDVLAIGQAVCSVWSNQCAQCGATNVLSVEQSMCLLWSNQCAHCGATCINVLTVEQPMCSLCGANNLPSVGQPMCLLWSSQCAYCGATNVLTVEQRATNVLTVKQSVCIQIYISNIHATVRQPNQSISNQLDIVLCMQQTEISRALSTILCGVLSRVQQCRVLWRWDKDVYMLFPGCVAACLRGMGTFNCGSSVRLHYWEKVSYYEWQDQVS